MIRARHAKRVHEASPICPLKTQSMATSPPLGGQYRVSRAGQSAGPDENSAIAELMLRGEATDADIVWFEGRLSGLP